MTTSITKSSEVSDCRTSNCECSRPNSKPNLGSDIIGLKTVDPQTHPDTQKVNDAHCSNGPATPVCILFVDDEPMVVKMGKRLLSKLGYSIEGFTNSEEALNHFQINPQAFDIVITDETMPGLKGHALAKALLKIRPNIPIILSTGYCDNIDPQIAKSIGIKEFVSKPIEISRLDTIIRHILA